MTISEPFSLVKVASGEWTMRSNLINETFHPVLGPTQEAVRLYIEPLKIVERASRLAKEFVIWDVGLGAAANAVLAINKCANVNCKLRVLSFDKTIEPLEFALKNVSKLQYLRELKEPVSELINKKETKIHLQNCSVTWNLVLGDFPSVLYKAAGACHLKKESDFITCDIDLILKHRPHAIFYDAYSPASNPEMWKLQHLRLLRKMVNDKDICALATYSRSTMVRVALLLAGFYVGYGPCLAEKEETTIACNHMQFLEQPLGLDWLRKAKRSTCAEPLDQNKYEQKKISEESWDRLISHPQFSGCFF